MQFKATLPRHIYACVYCHEESTCITAFRDIATCLMLFNLTFTAFIYDLRNGGKAVFKFDLFIQPQDFMYLFK